MVFSDHVLELAFKLGSRYSDFSAEAEVGVRVIIAINDIAIFRMLRMVSLLSCGFETFVSLANAQVAKPKIARTNTRCPLQWQDCLSDFVDINIYFS